MSASLHDPKHAYWCAVPWCPQYVRNHDRRAASPSGPSPAAGLDRDTIVQALADYEAEHGHQGWKYGDAADFIVARLSRSGGEAR